MANIETQRIAKNTVVLYFRMLFLMLIGLYTSRIIFKTLVVADYGTYSFVDGVIPKVIMGNGISETVSKFRTAPLEQGEERYLVVDSDEKIVNRADLVKRINNKCSPKNCKIEATEGNTFFMEQEVEAWILSQPEALKKRGIREGLPVNNIPFISKPSQKLSELIIFT